MLSDAQRRALAALLDRATPLERMALDGLLADNTPPPPPPAAPGGADRVTAFIREQQARRDRVVSPLRPGPRKTAA